MMPTNHDIIDSDDHYIIDPSTRRIKTESSKKTVLMQGDHNSERITFEMPRYVENHDMSECDSIKIHYNNIDSTTKETKSGVYEVGDIEVSRSDENTITFSWLVSGNATKYSGGLVFLIQFICYDATVISEIDYSWSTSIYEGINVLSGFNNTEFVVEKYVDVLEQWKKELLDASAAYYIPSVDDDGNLTWTPTNPDLVNIPSSNIKGDMYILTESDKEDIAEIVKTKYFNELETMIDESGVLIE